MDYDTEARRDTPLASALAARIAAGGPIRLDDYMRACLLDPNHGYYRSAIAIGRDGDFITAPEISQIFGELIGLWSVVAWRQMGSPARINLIELGAGRGTLLRDALRAARVAPAFREAVTAIIVETSTTLRAVQQRALADAGVEVRWVETPDAVAAGAPAIVVGNELLDTLAIRQWRRDGEHWLERYVGLDLQGRLQFSWQPAANVPLPVAMPGEPADFVERRPEMQMFLIALLARLALVAPCSALLIDYGEPTPAASDTLQAVRGHRHEHPLTSPGEADLTSQVDFSEIVHCARSSGLAVDGPITQAAFLGSLGIIERASRLMAANPARAGEIEASIARLLAEPGMGSRFKVIGTRNPALPPLPGFPVDRPPGRD